MRWRYHTGHYVFQYLCVNDKESSKQFHQNKKNQKTKITKQAQTGIHKSSVGTRSCKITFAEMKSTTNSGLAVDQKLYIPVKWIHVLSFVSLLFLADLGNIWKKIFSRRRRTSLRIRLKSGVGGWGNGLMEELEKLFLLPYCCFSISRRLFAMKLFFTYLHFNPWNSQANPFVPAGAPPGLNCHHPQLPSTIPHPLWPLGHFLPSAVATAGWCQINDGLRYASFLSATAEGEGQFFSFFSSFCFIKLQIVPSAPRAPNVFSFLFLFCPDICSALVTLSFSPSTQWPSHPIT